MLTLLVQTERVLSNYRALQKLAGKTPMIPVLEANAYGLGDTAVARLLADNGVRTIGVSRLEEAVRIAEAVRGVDIILMTPYSGEAAVQTILENDIIAAVGSNDAAVLFSSLSRTLHKRARIQLCIDFGMGRFGYEPAEASKAAQTIKHLGNLEMTGVFTVLPSGKKGGRKRREAQVKDFERVLAAISREDLSTGIAHMADVCQADLSDGVQFSALRTGADLFGRGMLRERYGLKKVGRAVAEVCDLKWLAAGSTLGDDGARRVRKATRVAVVTAGIADGLFLEDRKPGLFPPKKWCEIGGKRAAVIGRVGMTALTVDVTNVECAVGDIVSFDADTVGINAYARRDYV